MNKTLLRITKPILYAKPEGVSKVRLAKLVYFTHKELIRKGLARAENLAYIRMPLGPVPDGLMTLSDVDDITMSKRQTGLLYDAHVYKLGRAYEPSGSFDKVVGSTLSALDKFYTTELVEISHKEPTWREHSNSEHYFIAPADLKNKLPHKFRKRKELKQDIAEQKMQAFLVAGMIDDIVDESTGLEFPDVDSN